MFKLGSANFMLNVLSFSSCDQISVLLNMILLFILKNWSERHTVLLLHRQYKCDLDLQWLDVTGVNFEGFQYVPIYQCCIVQLRKNHFHHNNLQKSVLMIFDWSIHNDIFWKYVRPCNPKYNEIINVIKK